MFYAMTQITGSLIVTLGYYFVIFEEHYGLKKSIPMILSATVLWIFIGSSQILSKEELESIFSHEFLEFCKIFFFITVAISYVFALEEFGFFQILHKSFAQRSLSSRRLFWMTGLATFCLSPFLDNLTASLLMGQIFLSFAPNEAKLIRFSFLNIVLAANAGGVFSPFGDLTSLMIWQAGLVPTSAFQCLMLPSIVSYLVPAFVLSLQFENRELPRIDFKKTETSGSGVIAVLFFITILFTLLSQYCFGLPPVFGMLSGLGFLALYEHVHHRSTPSTLFSRLKRMDWDILLFFYGIILSIEGLKALGVLDILSHWLYTSLPTFLGFTDILWMASIGHIMMGMVSAIIDNIPIMAAVLKMPLVLSLGSWLLLTLTTGIGGSLLSIGSAAGIALMGLSRNHYTFQSHLKWTPLILLGYVLGIASHFWLNATLF